MFQFRVLTMSVVALALISGCGVGATPTPKPLLASDLMALASAAVEGGSSFEATLLMKVEGQGQDMEMTGDMALADRKIGMEMSLSGTGIPFGLDVAQIMSPPYVFMKVQGLGVDDTWFRIAEEEIFGTGQSFDAFFDGMENPAAMMGLSDEDFAALGELIDQAITVTKIGSGTVEGDPVDKYAYQVDWAKYWAILQEAGVEFQGAPASNLNSSASAAPEIRYSQFEQWVDEDWFPRRIIMKMTLDELVTTEMDITYRNVNGDVRVDEPLEFTDGLPGT